MEAQKFLKTEKLYKALVYALVPLMTAFSTLFVLIMFV
jgi:hypothetical protein